jgi:hypothetical protein
MGSEEIEEFARKLVQAVRDRGVQGSDLKMRPGSRTVTARRWQAAGATDPEGAPKVVVPDAVDETVFALLTAIDQGVLRLQYVTDDGKVVDLSEEGLGELGGWYLGPDGWRHRYSEQRFFEFTD